MRPKLSAVAIAALVLLAGCAGAPGVGPGADGDTTTPADSDVNSGESVDTGTVRFYISDERNAIGDFEHLNVTVTRVGLHRANESGDAGADEEMDSENETTTNATTVDTTTTTTVNETTEANKSTTAEPEDDEAEEERDEAEEDEEEERGGWVTHDVDNRTIDLTEYQGANATLLDNLTVPNGTYDTVFVYVSGINATLDSGESVNVKLPSSKLHVNKGFTVGNGESVDFVFDITVFKAGNSGKYILKPVVSQSGTDVPIETPDRGEREDRGDRGDERTEDAKESEESEADEDDRKGQGQGPPGENRSDGPEAGNGDRGDLLTFPSL